MDATITITIKDLESWDQYKNFTIPEMEEDLQEHIVGILSSELGYDKLEIVIS